MSTRRESHGSEQQRSGSVAQVAETSRPGWESGDKDIESRSGVLRGGRSGEVEAPEPPPKIAKEEGGDEDDLRAWARAWAESFPPWSDAQWREMNYTLGYRLKEED